VSIENAEHDEIGWLPSSSRRHDVIEVNVAGVPGSAPKLKITTFAKMRGRLGLPPPSPGRRDDLDRFASLDVRLR
jgi:hypothetical protein